MYNVFTTKYKSMTAKQKIQQRDVTYSMAITIEIKNFKHQAEFYLLLYCTFSFVFPVISTCCCLSCNTMWFVILISLVIFLWVTQGFWFLNEHKCNLYTLYICLYKTYINYNTYKIRISFVNSKSFYHIHV